MSFDLDERALELNDLSAFRDYGRDYGLDARHHGCGPRALRRANARRRLQPTH